MTAKFLILPLIAAAAFLTMPASAQLPRTPVTAGAGPGYQPVPPGVPLSIRT